MDNDKNKILVNKVRENMAKTGISTLDKPGKYAETAVTTMLRTFVSDYSEGKEKGPEAKRSKARDFLLGTDLMLNDPARMLTSRNLTRLDVTLDFDGKNNMPLVTPDKKSFLRSKGYNLGTVPIGDTGDYFRFGIRVGNARYGFDNPVVVIGLCSDREEDMDIYRIQYTMEEMHKQALKMSSEIIRGANRAMNRFRYMTSSQYQEKIDKMYSPDQVMARFPILIPNENFLQQEWDNCYVNEKRRERDKVCVASLASPARGLILDSYTEDTIKVFTKIPWMSQCGHDAIEAMAKCPVRIKDPHSAMARSYLLKEPIREPGQEPIIVADRKGNPIPEDARPPILRELAKHLDKQFDDARDMDDGPDKP